MYVRSCCDTGATRLKPFFRGWQWSLCGLGPVMLSVGDDVNRYVERFPSQRITPTRHWSSIQLYSFAIRHRWRVTFFIFGCRTPFSIYFIYLPQNIRIVSGKGWALLQVRSKRHQLRQRRSLHPESRRQPTIDRKEYVLVLFLLTIFAFLIVSFVFAGGALSFGIQEPTPQSNREYSPC